VWLDAAHHLFDARHPVDRRTDQNPQQVRSDDQVLEMTRRRRTTLDDSNWHLDKKVPIALILAMAMQTAGVVWWGATTSERLSALERKADAAAPQAERLARVETKLESVQNGISEIKSILTPPVRR
jgi:hypothetical protein